MPAWFSKVFQSKPPTAAPAEASAPVYEPEAVLDDEEDELPKPRKVVNAPVLMGDDTASGSSNDIRIKAKLDEMNETVVFMVDRPVLAGHSFWCPDRETAYANAPLAGAIFDVGGVHSVLLHDTTVTVTRQGGTKQSLEEFAKEAGQQIRAHLKSGMPVLLPEVMDQMPSEEEVRAGIQAVIDREINPGIASHSGVITLDRVQGNTVYITMGGGCQGCAASSITLRSGVERAFREAVPMLGAVLDQTDHTAGTNPFFTALPVGMGG
ncbi:MAG: NifU family protein [Candidatus Hydrogenedentes bacterium]|nr:NifU family protein [Candidatus Hydrogenedentota bacterium]